MTLHMIDLRYLNNEMFKITQLNCKEMLLHSTATEIYKNNVNELLHFWSFTNIIGVSLVTQKVYHTLSLDSLNSRTTHPFESVYDQRKFSLGL